MSRSGFNIYHLFFQIVIFSEELVELLLIYASKFSILKSRLLVGIDIFLSFAVSKIIIVINLG